MSIPFAPANPDMRRGLRALALAVIPSLAAGALVAIASERYHDGPLVVVGLSFGLPMAVTLVKRFPESLLIAMLSGTMLFSDRTLLATGLPSVGLNVIDILVLAALVALVAQWGRCANLIDRDRVAQLLLLELALGGVFLGFGASQGVPLRTALRDFRFFVYVPVIYLYTALVCQQIWRLRTLLIGWYIVVGAQFVAIATGWLILYEAPGTQYLLVPSAAYSSPWHFMGSWSFLPLFVSSYSAAGPVGLTPRQRVLHWITIGISAVVLFLTFNRTLWLTLPFAFLVTAIVANRRILSAVLSLRVIIQATVVVILITTAAAFAGLGQVLRAGSERLISSASVSEDMAISNRLQEDIWTLDQIARNPFGHGLGVGNQVGSDLTLHMGYLWLAYHSGLLSLVVFILILGIGLRQARRSVAEARLYPTPRLGWLMGITAVLASLVLSATAGTELVSFISLPYVGLLLGLLVPEAKRVPIHLPRPTMRVFAGQRPTPG